MVVILGGIGKILGMTTQLIGLVADRYVLLQTRFDYGGSDEQPDPVNGYAIELPSTPVTEFSASSDGARFLVVNRSHVFSSYSGSDLAVIVPSNHLLYIAHYYFRKDVDGAVDVLALGPTINSGFPQIHYVGVLPRGEGDNRMSRFILVVSGLVRSDGKQLPFYLTCQPYTVGVGCDQPMYTVVDPSNDPLLENGTVITSLGPGHALVYNPDYRSSDGRRGAIWDVMYDVRSPRSRRIRPVVDLDTISTMSMVPIIIGNAVATGTYLSSIVPSVAYPPDARFIYNVIGGLYIYGGASSVATPYSCPDYRAIYGFTNGFLYRISADQDCTVTGFTPYAYVENPLGSCWPLYTYDVTGKEVVVAVPKNMSISFGKPPCKYYIPQPSDVPGYSREQVQWSDRLEGSVQFRVARLRVTDFDAAGVAIDVVDVPVVDGGCTEIGSTDMYNVAITTTTLTIEITNIVVSKR